MEPEKKNLLNYRENSKSNIKRPDQLLKKTVRSGSTVKKAVRFGSIIEKRRSDPDQLLKKAVR